jgi:hypothetical protein
MGRTTSVCHIQVSEGAHLRRTASPVSSEDAIEVNAASVKTDGAKDDITIADALFIAQYLVGIRDANFALP